MAFVATSRLAEADHPSADARPMSESTPLTTGAVARLLNTTEPRVAETVRRGRIHPEPDIVAGRRLWTHEQVLQAAEALGVLTDDLRAQLAREVSDG